MAWLWFRPTGRKIVSFFQRLALDTPVYMGDKTRVTVGERVALANTVLNVASGSISIGDRTIFSPNVMLLTGRHDFFEGTRVSLHPQFDDSSWGGAKWEVPQHGNDIVIGSGCWLCAGSIVIGGVTLGNNVIVAAGAVVTTDVPDFSIVGGIPARKIGDTRDLPTPPQIAGL